MAAVPRPGGPCSVRTRRSQLRLTARQQPCYRLCARTTSRVPCTSRRIRCHLAGRDDPGGSSVSGSDVEEVTFRRESTTLIGDLGDIDVSSSNEVPGLKSTPMGSPVSNATDRYSLPDPALAVRNLIEGAQYAHLCTNMSAMHHRRSGYPFGMLVDFAADGAGFPIFCLSPLSIHSHNVHEDPRCSLVVQMPGWLGLSNARVTMFGDVFVLPDSMQATAKDVFLQKHASGASNKGRVISDSFRFYRMMNLQDIYFVGGFGTMQWIDIDAYVSCDPDAIVMYHPHETIEHLSDQFGEQLVKLFAAAQGAEWGASAADASVISIDARGMDVRVRHKWQCTMHRLPFDAHVQTPAEAERAVERALSA